MTLCNSLSFNKQVAKSAVEEVSPDFCHFMLSVSFQDACVVLLFSGLNVAYQGCPRLQKSAAVDAVRMSEEKIRSLRESYERVLHDLEETSSRLQRYESGEKRSASKEIAILRPRFKKLQHAHRTLLNLHQKLTDERNWQDQQRVSRMREVQTVRIIELALLWILMSRFCSIATPGLGKDQITEIPFA
jgi:DNA repair exonuclease SbcCD ATPase subunit